MYVIRVETKDKVKDIIAYYHINEIPLKDVELLWRVLKKYINNETKMNWGLLANG